MGVRGRFWWLETAVGFRVARNLCSWLAIKNKGVHRMSGGPDGGSVGFLVAGTGLAREGASRICGQRPPGRQSAGFPVNRF